MVVIRLVESNVVLSVDAEVTRVDVVALHHHLEDLWLMHFALFHEVDNFVLDHDCVVCIVLNLDLELILKLSLLCHNLFGFSRLSKILIVFGKEVHFTDMCP